MVFSIKNNSPISTLLELTTRVVDANEPNAADLHVTLMVQPDEIDLGDFTIEVKIVSALICVEANGCETDPNLKYGLRKNEAVERRKKSTELSIKAAVSSSVAGEAMMGGKIDPLKLLSLDGSVKRTEGDSRSEEFMMKETEIQEIEHLTVEAIGSDRWRVCHAQSKPLRGQYISDERLCRLVQRSPSSNRFGATISAQIKKRDIDVEVIQQRKRMIFGVPNKSKILALLVSKALEGQLQDNSAETITFATSEVADEG